MTTPDASKTEAFVESLFADLNGGMSAMVMYLGLNLGLFDDLATHGASTAREMAERTNLNERYVLEWLSGMAAGEYLAYDASSDRFSIPPEHVDVLTNPGNPNYAVGVVKWVPSFANVLPQLQHAFRNGGGVTYADYGEDMVSGQGESTRPMFVNEFVPVWLPTMPDVEAKLQAGGKALEVGGGIGWASIALAEAMPGVSIDAVDPDELSQQHARENALEAGVSSITFYDTTIEDAPLNGPYDLVWGFECLHDMPYPVSVLRRMRELAAPDGAVLIADERVEDSLPENTNFLGHLFYNFSILHCLPQAMVFPDAAGTGTVITPSTLKRYAEEAGFSSVEILPIDNFQFRFYRLNP